MELPPSGFDTIPTSTAFNIKYTEIKIYFFSSAYLDFYLCQIRGPVFHFLCNCYANEYFWRKLMVEIIDSKKIVNHLNLVFFIDVWLDYWMGISGSSQKMQMTLFGNVVARSSFFPVLKSLFHLFPSRTWPHLGECSQSWLNLAKFDGIHCWPFVVRPTFPGVPYDVLSFLQILLQQILLLSVSTARNSKPVRIWGSNSSLENTMEISLDMKSSVIPVLCS